MANFDAVAWTVDWQIDGFLYGRANYSERSKGLASGVRADDFGTQIRFLTSVAIPTDLLSSNIFALIGLPKCGIICFGSNLLLNLILRE